MSFRTVWTIKSKIIFDDYILLTSWCVTRNKRVIMTFCDCPKRTKIWSLDMCAEPKPGVPNGCISSIYYTWPQGGQQCFWLYLFKSYYLSSHVKCTFNCECTSQNIIKKQPEEFVVKNIKDSTGAVITLALSHNIKDRGCWLFLLLNLSIDYVTKTAPGGISNYLVGEKKPSGKTAVFAQILTFL